MAPSITAYLANGSALEHAQEMAAHESPRTTKLTTAPKSADEGRGIRPSPQPRHDYDFDHANVALPHVQGSLSASLDQIAWALTSYIVCAAIMMPLTGWLAGRFGIKYIFLASVIGFTLASALCGGATSLGELVLFRAVQGVAGGLLGVERFD